MNTPAHFDDQGASEQGNWSCDAIGLADPCDRRGSLVVAGCVAGIVVILGVGWLSW